MRIDKKPIDITPRDDAFHGSRHHIAAEWWYFDAIFNNNYSIHVGVKTFTWRNLGLVSPLIEVYRDGEIKVEAKKVFLLRDAILSKETPFISLRGKPIMYLDKEKLSRNNKWVYHVDLELPSCSTKLEFTGTTNGWVFKTPSESWAVALPKAVVRGEINLDGDSIPVEGVGYHDHNWNYTILTVMNYGIGWYWGKVTTSAYSLVWAQIEKSDHSFERYAVINVDGGRFYNIPSNKMNIIFEDFVRSHLRRTPTTIILRIHDTIDGTPIDVDVKMKAKGIHYNAVITAPYWRYHVASEGTISIDSRVEKVNKTQIMEILKFS